MIVIKKIIFVTLCILATAGADCSPYYVSIAPNGSKGLINKEGDVIIPSIYKNVSLYDGLWVLWNTPKDVKLVSKNKNITLNFALKNDGLLKCYMLSANHICFKYLEKSCIVKLDGGDQYSYHWFRRVAQNYSGNLIPVQKNENWFILNHNMKIVRGVSCVKMRAFSDNGLAVFMGNKKKYGYMNNRGEILKQANYKLATGFINGVALVRESEGSLRMIDSKFNVISTMQINSFKPPLKRSKGVVIRSGEKWGLVGLDGKLIIEPKYDWLTTLTDSGGLGCRDGFIYMINKYGREGASVKLQNTKIIIDDGRDLILVKTPKALFYVTRSGKKMNLP